MKKLLLSSLFCLAIAGTAFAQGTSCTPNPAYSVPGIYPEDSLPPAVVGQPYDEVIDFVMPLDTIVNIPPFGNTQAYFCSFKLVGSGNLPAGMDFYCSGNLDPNDATNRTWKVDHTPGVINRGCVRLIGTPQSCLPVADMDSLKMEIYIAASFTNPATAGGVCTPVPGIPATLTTQNFKMFWRVSNCNVSVDGDLAKAMKFTIAPNPTNSEATVSLEMPRNEKLQVSICDIMGREIRSVFNENTHQGTHTFNVNTADLTPGVYFVKATVGNTKVVTQKMMVNH